jgi:hypothetical protein
MEELTYYILKERINVAVENIWVPKLPLRIVRILPFATGKWAPER